MADFAAICRKVAFTSVLFIPVFSASATKCAASRASPTMCRAMRSSQSAAAAHDQRDEYRSEVADSGHHVFSSTVAIVPCCENGHLKAQAQSGGLANLIHRAWKNLNEVLENPSRW